MRRKYSLDEFDKLFYSSQKSMKNKFVALLLAGIFALTGGGMILSFPSAYLLEYWIAQWRGCSVPLDNPVLRTGLGLVVGIGLVSPITGGITKAIDNSRNDDVSARGAKCL